MFIILLSAISLAFMIGSIIFFVKSRAGENNEKKQVDTGIALTACSLFVFSFLAQFFWLIAIVLGVMFFTTAFLAGEGKIARIIVFTISFGIYFFFLMSFWGDLI